MRKRIGNLDFDVASHCVYHLRTHVVLCTKFRYPTLTAERRDLRDCSSSFPFIYVLRLGFVENRGAAPDREAAFLLLSGSPRCVGSEIREGLGLDDGFEVCAAVCRVKREGHYRK